MAYSWVVEENGRVSEVVLQLQDVAQAVEPVLCRATRQPSDQGVTGARLCQVAPHTKDAEQSAY